MPEPCSGHDATVSRVLMVTTSPERRGAEVFASALADELDARGHSCTVMAVRPTTSDRPLPVRVAGRSRWDPVGLARLTRAAAAHDVVVGHGSVTLIAGAAIAAGARRPFIYRSIGDPEQWGDVRLASLRVRRPMRRAAAVVALYDRARGALIDRHGLPPGRVRVIPNAVDANGLGPVDEGARAAARARLGSTTGSGGSATSVPSAPRSGRRSPSGSSPRRRARAWWWRATDRCGPGPSAWPRRWPRAGPGSWVPWTTPGSCWTRWRACCSPAARRASRPPPSRPGCVGCPWWRQPWAAWSRSSTTGAPGGWWRPGDGDDGGSVGPLQEALLDALAHAVPMGVAARERCLSRYSMSVVADSWSALVDEVVNHPSGGRARRGT